MSSAAFFIALIAVLAVILILLLSQRYSELSISSPITEWRHGELRITLREQQYEYDRQHRYERDKKGGRGHGRSITGVSRVSTFKGATEEMNGSVFECQDEQSDRRQYAKTLKELQGYVKK